jgi:hypothetical protein
MLRSSSGAYAKLLRLGTPLAGPKQVGYVLAYLFNERYIGLADELFYVIEIQTMQQQWAKILHREQYNDLEDLKVEPNWGLIVNVPSTLEP